VPSTAGARDDAGVDAGPGAHADGHDRLAQGDQHDQAMALGEVARNQLPALGAEQIRPAHVQRQSQHPQNDLRRAPGGRSRDQQSDAQCRAGGEAVDRTPQRRLVAAGDGEQRDLGGPNGAIGAGEQHGLVAECLRHAQRHHQQCGHRTEDREANDALLWVDHAREPGVADPRPPEQGEHEQSLPELGPGRICGHQRRALRDRQDEDQVEEQLERGHPLLGAHHRGQARGVRGGGGAHARDGRIAVIRLRLV
jgi:hypothetical protein